MRETFRMEAVQTPVIPLIGEMIRQNPGTISLGQGVVYYGPPPEAMEKVQQFFQDAENHKYKPVQGIPPLIDAIEAKLQAENHLDVESRDCILVTGGGNMAFLNALLAITDPGDEVILPLPYYFNHDMAIAMIGCRPVPVLTDENYQLRLDALADAITPRTRAIVTVSPNNPSGVVYSEADLLAVNTLCRERGIYHIHDEAYEYFTYDGAKHFSPGAIAGSSAHTISLYSLSKAYGFASWRIGYMVFPKRLLVAIKKIQDTNLICAPVVSQFAAVGALQAGAAYCHEKLKAIEEVRAMGVKALAPLEREGLCTIPLSQGAFYFLLKVHAEWDALDLVERLIRDYKVAVMPGTTFGMENGCYLRVAYASLQKETIEEGLGRLVQGLQALVKGKP